MINKILTNLQFGATSQVLYDLTDKAARQQLSSHISSYNKFIEIDIQFLSGEIDSKSSKINPLFTGTVSATTVLNKNLRGQQLATTKFVGDVVSAVAVLNTTSAHVHAISDVTNLQDQLNKKQNAITVSAKLNYNTQISGAPTALSAFIQDENYKTVSQTQKNNWSSKAASATTLAGYGITDAYTKSEVDLKVSSVYRYKGSKQNYSDLPIIGNIVGDVWNIVNADPTHGILAGDNVAWNSSSWDKLAGTIDLSNYQKKFTSDYKLDYSYISGTTALSTFTQDENHKTISQTQKNTWNAKVNPATTLSGYGIIDAYTKTEVNNALSTKAPSAHIHAISDITNLQAQLNNKAAINNPLFTGIPSAPVITDKTLRTQQIATTKFVGDVISAVAVLNTTSAHVHAISDITNLQNQLNQKAAINNPLFTGTASATTVLDKNLRGQQLATTKFVGDVISAIAVLNTASAHVHTIGDITNLQDQLNDKLDKRLITSTLVSTSITIPTLAENTNYHYGTLNTLKIENIPYFENETNIFFKTGDSITVTVPSDLKFIGDHVFEPSSEYVINIVCNIAVIGKVEAGE